MTTESRRLFATTTDVGTAMAETALCSEHNTEEWRKSVLSHVSQPDGSDFVFYDCTGNNVLSCQVCGWPQEEADSSTQPVKQPVYIRSDFDNVYVELTDEQAKRLTVFARGLEKEGQGDAFDRVNAALKELWAVAEEAGLMVLCNDDEAEDGSPQVVLTLEGEWPDGK